MWYTGFIIGMIVIIASKYGTSLFIKRVRNKVILDSQSILQLKETLIKLEKEEKNLIKKNSELENKAVGLRQLVDKLDNKLVELNKKVDESSSPT